MLGVAEFQTYRRLEARKKWPELRHVFWIWDFRPGFSPGSAGTTLELVQGCAGNGNVFFFLNVGNGNDVAGVWRFSLSHLKPQPRWEWNNGMDQEDQVILSLRG